MSKLLQNSSGPPPAHPHPPPRGDRRGTAQLSHAWGVGPGWGGYGEGVPDGSGRGCRCRLWVPDRGGTSRAKRAGCLGNPRRPGHSSHATGRILKAPVPSPGSSPGPPPAPPLPLHTPPALAAGTGPHPAPRSPPVAAAPRCRRCPEPRGERERGKTAPVCAVPGGRGDSPPPSLRKHAGVSVDHPQHRHHTRRVPPAGWGI